MTDAERREASRQFIQKWNGRGKEDEDDRSYWIDILQDVLGQDKVTSRVEFQKKVIKDGNTKRIDAYIPETKVIIEQKSLGIDLSKPQSGHDGMTPYEQAKMYNDNLPSSEKARWIVTSNFAEIWVYDMDTRVPEDNITVINLVDLQDNYRLLDFLVKEEVQKISQEVELSIKAGELVGKIHDRFLEQYNDPMAVRTQHSLNILCVRLVFCLYAEDAGLFGETDAFKNYIEQYDPKDIRRALLDLFKVLNTPEEERAELYLDDELEAFPYCNGGLFARENIEIPKITEELKQTLVDASSFDWSKISPTIFGAVFESTLNPETRRSGGMHYTSIENIHKVIDPLFLDDLKKELEEAKALKVQKTRETRLRAFQDKLASLKFLDPACGSGNFLTETYVSIRRLENEVLMELNQGQIAIGMGNINPIKVSIDQFYGIEINDFAVTVAKAALWIAESQMMKETEDVVHMNLDFLPLKTNATIVEGNALTLDWKRIVSPSELSYIMGNPPFRGSTYQSDDQKQDMVIASNGAVKKIGLLDFVCGWYLKAGEYIDSTSIKCAFVSTNSITQGDQPSILWKRMFELGCEICFAYRTFVWNSEASIQASVHCVIIGFSQKNVCNKKILFSGKDFVEADNINPYLVDGDNILVEASNKLLCDVPQMIAGNKPVRAQALFLTPKEKDDLIKGEPQAEKYIKRIIGSVEFINNKLRYVLWLVDASPNELKSMPQVMKRVEAVKEDRITSADKQANKLAEVPHLFRDKNNPETAIVIPIVSSSARRYIPMGYIDKDTIASNKVGIIPNGTMYHFGVLSSNVHNSWMRCVAMRMKSDYSYSVNIVYNNFPWPNPTEEQKKKIEETAQGIIDARSLYPDSSLAELYDPITMPIELRKAHQANDRAVMQAYGLDVKNTSEADCVAHLMKMYQELVGEK